MRGRCCESPLFTGSRHEAARGVSKHALLGSGQFGKTDLTSEKQIPRCARDDSGLGGNLSKLTHCPPLASTFLIAMLLSATLLVATARGAAANLGPNSADYIVVDVRTRAVIAQQWPGADTPIPMGSLVKPFTALACRSSGGPGSFPEFVCRGTASRCWLPHGHGRVGFREALAQSCNAYFLNLARDVDANTLAVVAAKFGIAPPAADTVGTRIGLGSEWRISPVAMARAYCELASRAGEPRVDEILSGLEAAARSGTASAIGPGFLAKTGTSPGADRKHAADGFTIVLAPAEAPRIALLVRVRGVTGATAAKSAAQILLQMREMREKQ